MWRRNSPLTGIRPAGRPRVDRAARVFSRARRAGARGRVCMHGVCVCMVCVCMVRVCMVRVCQVLQAPASGSSPHGSRKGGGGSTQRPPATPPSSSSSPGSQTPRKPSQVEGVERTDHPGPVRTADWLSQGWCLITDWRLPITRPVHNA